MTTKKVDDLTIEELNEQVALCNDWVFIKDGCFWVDKNGNFMRKNADHNPCHNAQQAFEIMDKYKIGVFPVYKNNSYHWEAYLSYKAESKGDTALIAICRCYVKYVKGETVEV